jgi:hypothetical protein
MKELKRRLASTGSASGETAPAEGSPVNSLSGKKLERFEEKLRTGRQL